MQLHFSGLWVLLTLLKVNLALWKFISLTFTSYSDVDECNDYNHDCHVNGTCTNTAGSFECVCNDGYFGDGRNCSGSHPDPEIRVDRVTQKFFSAIRASLWSKSKERALPLDPPLSSESNLLTLIDHIVEWSESEGRDRRFAFYLHMHANEAWTASLIVHFSRATQSLVYVKLQFLSEICVLLY